ncbi:MAG: response regulator [Anaerolineae bacterium]
MRPVRPTVLIIDDDLPTLALYQRELGRDYRVLTCSDEQSAVECLRVENLSAVVLEPVALGKQGWDLLTTIKTREPERSIPIILCSTQDERRRGLEMGAAACLTKPVLPTALRRALDQVTHRL